MSRLSGVRDALRLRAVWWGILGSTLLTVASYDARRLPDSAPVRFGQYTIVGLHLAPVLVTLLLAAGAGALTWGWLRLRAMPLPAPGWAILTLWSAPMLFAAPLYSNDLYSYAAQGRQIELGVNPYGYGPTVGDPDFREQVDSFWVGTAAPYGPVGLQLARAVVRLFRDDPWLSAIGMRLIAIVALTVLVLTVPLVAKRMPGGPGTWERSDLVRRRHAGDFALWLGVLNPLTVIHFMGGAHNDALMVALISAAMFVALNGRRTGHEMRREGYLMVATILIALAALIKQPAILGLPAAIVLAQPSWPTKTWRRWSWLLQDVALSGATFVVTFVAFSLASGLGFGWIKALRVPGSVASLAPMWFVTEGMQWFGRATGAPEVGVQAANVFKILALLVAGVVVAWLAWRMVQDPRRTPGYLVGSWLAVALAMPALQQWYLLWGGVFLGTVAWKRRHLRFLLAAVIFLVIEATADVAFGRVRIALLVAALLTLPALGYAVKHVAVHGDEDAASEPLPDELSEPAGLPRPTKPQPAAADR